MQIYWTLKSIPELSGLPSDDERRSVWRDALSKIMKRWQYWVSLIGIVPVCTVIGDMLIGHRLLGPVIGAGVGGFIFGQVGTHLARPYIRDLLSDEAFPSVFE